MNPIQTEIDKFQRQIDEWMASHSDLGYNSIDAIRRKAQEIQSCGRGVSSQSHQKAIFAEEKLFRQKEAKLALPEGGIETVNARFQEQEEKMTNITREIANHTENYKGLADAHKKFSEKYAKLQEFLSATIQDTFEIYCEHKNYIGKLTFDHEKKTLVSKVDVNSRDGARRESSFGGHKQLSGGENSYSNVCLLLALSSVSPCPWQVLDEFDVFM